MWRITPSAVILLALTVSVSASLPLAEQPWREEAYGLSMRLPEDMVPAPRLGSDVKLSRMDRNHRMALVLSVKRPLRRLTLAQLAEEAKRQVALNVDQMIDTKRSRRLEIDGRPVEVIYYRLPDIQGIKVHNRRWRGDEMLIQAIAPIDPVGSRDRLTATHYVLIEARYRPADDDWVPATFEAMLSTLKIPDQQKLLQEREKAIRQGEAWRRRLTAEQLHAALVPEQVFRVVNAEGRDVGWVIERHERVTRELKPGVEIKILRHMRIPPFRVDVQAEYFLSDDRTYERWKAVQTQRPLGRVGRPGSGGPPGEVISTAETGVRVPARGEALAKIDIVLDGPDGKNPQSYRVPARGYLSRVEALLLPRLLPRDVPTTYGFYAYSPEEAGIRFRTDRIVPALGGHTHVAQPAPNTASIASDFGRDGNLLEQRLPGGKRLLPTTTRKLRVIWPGR